MTGVQTCALPIFIHRETHLANGGELDSTADSVRFSY